MQSHCVENAINHFTGDHLHSVLFLGTKAANIVLINGCVAATKDKHQGQEMNRKSLPPQSHSLAIICMCGKINYFSLWCN